MNKITVREVFDPKNNASAIVPAEEPLKDVITRFARDMKLRGVFVTDPIGRFSGVITRNDLLKWTHLQLGSSRGDITMSPRDIYRLASSTKAQDLATGDHTNYGVRLDDDISMALKMIIEHGEIDLPVLDKDGRILGDLKISQILLHTIQVGERQEARA
ncbi:MAG: CBS domain-containing protein [SAR202 cluster bacterium]|nr:CBS domain-containing protein [SAR202 cluster bacterium]